MAVCEGVKGGSLFECWGALGVPVICEGVGGVWGVSLAQSGGALGVRAMSECGLVCVLGVPA